ncbi:MAG: hypothetical protein IJK81_00500 [Selenomonadaceae bacterium]|nr:hypothetical protein [Selenomonadaceae bacterium]
MKIPTYPMLKYKEAIDNGTKLELTYAEEMELRRSLRELQEGEPSSNPGLQMVNESTICIIRTILAKWEEDKTHD